MGREVRSAQSIHDRIEAGFERWGHFVVQRRISVGALSLVFSLVLVSGLARLEASFSLENFLLPGDDTLERYRAFREQFGWEDFTIVAVEPPEVFEPEALARLRELHRALEREVPYTKDVTSLVNARSTRGEDDVLIVEEFLSDWPESRDEAQALRLRALANPLYQNHLLTADARATILLIQLDTEWEAEPEDSEVLGGFDSEAEGDPAFRELARRKVGPSESTEHMNAIYEVVRRFDAANFRLTVAGGETLGQRLQLLSITNVAISLCLLVVVLAVLLFALTRRAVGALLPLFLVVLALSSTEGCMGWVGIPFTMTAQILPPFLITVGVCDAIHILTIVDQGLSRGLSRDDAIAAAMRKAGLPVVMTSLTTAGGLLSFLAVALIPVADIGRIAPFGILMAMLLSLTLLPALLAIVPLRARPSAAEGKGVGFHMARLAAAAGRRPFWTLALTGLLLALAMGGISKVRLGHDPLRWLLASDPARQAIEKIDLEVGGIGAVELVVDTGRAGGLYEPEVLRRIDSAVEHARSFKEGPVGVGKATSIVDILKEIHQALNEDDPAFYRVPDDRKVIAQEWLLFENSGWDDLESVTDAEFRIARVSLRVTLVDALYYQAFIARLDGELRDILGPSFELTWTGQEVLGSRAFSVVLPSLLRSYALALLIITPLMVLLIGDLRLGLISMVPNLLPVVFTLALMGWLEIPMNATTLLVGSIVIGIAVDDTIHVMHRFARTRGCTADPLPANRHTFETTGAALLVTSTALTAGFAVLIPAEIRTISHVGLVAGFSTLTALLADLLVTPALITLVTRRGHGSTHWR